MSELFDKVLSKRDLWAVISISVFLAPFLPVPENNLESFITRIIALSVVLSFILGKICNIENLWKLLFLRQLANIELYNRKFTANPSFFDLQKDSKEEINKLDDHIKEYFAEYVEILILLLISSPILFLIKSGFNPTTTFTAFNLKINTLILIVGVQILNILFLYNANYQIKKDFSIYKDIYKKYGV